jgi:bifunctional DNA-binding transcriptional regulator/antitoxin component of YhaV-PrlF toxin-antitoxin module
MDISTTFRNGTALRTNIPLNVRQALGIQPGDRLRWYISPTDHVRIYVGERDDRSGRGIEKPR